MNEEEKRKTWIEHYEKNPPKEIMKEEPKEPYELFGIECGKGWKPLYDRYFKWVEEYNKDKSDEEKVETTQIKEKFGRLTIYCSHYPNGLRELLNELENESATMCEECGKPCESRNKNYWIYTLCDDCYNELVERKRERMEEWIKKTREKALKEK